MKNKGYTIRSTSSEGVYYLVNGWDKHHAFWVEEQHIDKAIFKTAGQAKASLTKLLKVMDEYRTDTFELVAVSENGEISILLHRALFTF